MAPTPHDELLMARVKRGDQAALEALVRRHGTPLLSFLARMTSGRSDAEDLFQDTWVTVWARRSTFDTTRRFRPWLYRIAVSRCADWRRRARPAPADPGAWKDAGGPPVDTRLLRDERLAAAEAAIRQLPPAQREVVTLRLHASLAYAEIADTLGVTESAVRSNMSVALRTLRASLAPWAEHHPMNKEAADARAPSRE
jgi:RNA polymerase sigma-70 factor (ECF subfamily)